MGKVVKQPKVITSLNGGAGGGGVVSSIYSADDTIADQQRIVSLYDQTEDSSLSFDGILTFYGDNRSVFGADNDGTAIDIYLKSGADTFNIYGENGILSTRIYGNYNASTNAHFWQYNLASQVTLHMYNNEDGEYIEITGDNTNRFSMRSRTLLHGMQIETIAGYGGAYSYTISGYKSDGLCSMFLRGNDNGGFFSFGGQSTLTDNVLEVYGKTFIDGNTAFNQKIQLTTSTNTSLTGANARISTQPKSTMIYSNASLTSIASCVASTITGQILIIINETGGNLTIVDNYASAASGEKFLTGTGADLIILPSCSAMFQYNHLGGGSWNKL